MTDKEAELLEKIAEQQGRTRKNLCETEIRKLIRKQLFQQGNSPSHKVTFI